MEPIAVHDGDLAKPYAGKMEAIGPIRDGERMIRNDYHPCRAEDSICLLKCQLGIEAVQALSFRPLRRLVMVAQRTVAIINFLWHSLPDDQLRRFRKLVPCNVSTSPH